LIQFAKAERHRGNVAALPNLSQYFQSFAHVP